MSAKIIDGKAVAAEFRTQIAADVAQFVEQEGRKPGLAVVLVGDDPASQVYVRSKVKACKEVGIESLEHRLSDNTSGVGLLNVINYLNASSEVDGILVQLPLPLHIDPNAIIYAIDPRKDVDGFHPSNVGLLVQRSPDIIPCTPLGCLRLLQNHLGAKLRGMHAVVVGASNIVGRPMGQLLLLAGCTVTMTHRFTRDTPAIARQADIVIAAAGKPGLVTAEWIKPGATVIDVGINRVNGKIVGDVDFEGVKEVAGAITPVPGGVGPMTIAMLLQNTLQAARPRS
jgi:methylenetetrahydrofolate dehydrogenase (NADP+) / methenyltetrahydrofolate cyclohydrolase